MARVPSVRGARTAAVAPSEAQRSGGFGALPRPCLPCTPTLYEDAAGPPSFEAACVLALSALGDSQWDGCWRLDEGQEKRLFRRIANESGGLSSERKLLSSLKATEVSKEQILSFAKQDANRTAIQRLPKAVHGILSEWVVGKAFGTFDANQDHVLDIEEWSSFLECLEGLHLQFLMGQAFAGGRAFYARGQRWQAAGALGGPPEAMRREDVAEMAGSLFQGGKKCLPRAFQLGPDPEGLLPPGWAADLHYYCANNHPLYGIFVCDPNNPLSNTERFAMELATIGFTAACQAFSTWREKHAVNLHGLGATVAGMILWWSLFLLFTCPGMGRVDLSQPDAGGRVARRARCWSGLGATLGYGLLLLWLVFLGYVVNLKVHGVDTALARIDFTIVLAMRAKSYVVSLVLMVAMPFNPLLAWGQPDPTAGFNLGDYIGFGQWRIEKQRFQACCAELLEQARTRLHLVKSCAGCVVA